MLAQTGAPITKAAEEELTQGSQLRGRGLVQMSPILGSHDELEGDKGFIRLVKYSE